MRIALYFLIVLFVSSCAVSKVQSDAKPITHEDWNTLLQKHVNIDGFVDYVGFINDSTALNKYVAKLEAGHPNAKNWTDNEQIAYWINAYNAFTVQIVIRNYPVESIKDIGGSIPFTNTVWDQKFINIEGQIYDINNIEHGILRKHFEEPRIHVAVNCASYSCPPLRNEAFTPDRLTEQLNDQATIFINDGERNIIKTDSAWLSPIFTWFSGDFKETHDSVKDFVNVYSETPITKETVVGKTTYFWDLNEQQNDKAKKKRSEFLLNKGYSKATIKDFGATMVPCRYQIRLEDGTLLKANSTLPDRFKEGGKAVFIKYNELGKGSCDNAKEIFLVDITTG